MVTMWDWFVTNGVWIVLAVVVGLILFFLLRRWAPWIVQKLVPKQWQEQLKGTQKAVTWVIIGIGGVILALAVAGVVVSRYGVDITPALDAVGGWLLAHGIRILIIIGLAYLFYRIAKVVTPRILDRFVSVRGKGRRARSEHAKRAQTLSSAINQVITIFIVVIAIFMILSEIELDITPLLAGAGVAGIAIGFAAQSFIKDLIAGFLIISENQFDVGDVIKIADVIGLVEEVNLRRTQLRDLDGILHIVPNGEIRVASNYTMTWSRANLDISVAYKEDLDRVMAVVKRVWEETADDPQWGPQIVTKTPSILRVNEFGDSGIDIKVVGDTKPMMQWNVMGELRRRIKRAFDEEGIEIPWPHVKLYMGDKPAGGGITCGACSGLNPPGNKFCAHCGAKLTPQPTPKPTTKLPSRPTTEVKRSKGSGEGFGEGSGEGW
jgi:small-conductance mechanosensitive channel